MAPHRPVGTGRLARLSRLPLAVPRRRWSGKRGPRSRSALGSQGTRAARHFDSFLEHLWGLGVLDARLTPSSVRNRLGGWLKLGMVGTTPARGRVFLVGDAAGLVNPLQGEGISQAMRRGRAAAEAVLAGPEAAATRYRAYLASAFAPYQSAAAPAHAVLLPRPRATAALGRLLTAPGVGRVVAGGWSIFWNDLLEGAAPSPARSLASVAARVGRAAMAPTRTRRWFDQELGPSPGLSTAR